MNESNTRKEEKKSKHRELFVVVLFQFSSILLCLISLIFGVGNSAAEEFIPIPMHALNSGDYSSDDPILNFQKIGLDLIIEVLLDRDPQAIDVPSRATAVAVSMMTPVPTITPGIGGEAYLGDDNPAATSTDYPVSTPLPGETSTSLPTNLPPTLTTLVPTSQPGNTPNPWPIFPLIPSATPKLTQAPRNYSAKTATPTSTSSTQRTKTPTATIVSTGTPPGMDTPTVTATEIITSTASLTATSSPSSFPTTTVTPTGTGFPATSPTISPNPTSTVISSVTPTISPTAGTIPATDTPTEATPYTPTSTPASTDTVTATPNTSPIPTATFTMTDIPINTSTATLTTINTPTNPVTGTPAPSGTPSNTPLVTMTLTSVATNKPIPTMTNTPTNTSTMTSVPTNTATDTPSTTATNSPTPTALNTPINPSTLTPSSTISATYIPIPTSTDTPTSTKTRTPTNSLTLTPTHTITSTSKQTPTTTSTQTPTPATPTVTNSPANTPSVTPTPTPDLPECFIGLPPGSIPSDDSFIRATSPNSNFGTLPDIEVRPDNGANRRGLLRFDLSFIPPGSMVTDATLYLFEIDKKFDVETFLYRMTSQWDESTVTWNSPWTNPGGDYDNSHAYASFSPDQSNCMLAIDLTDLVQEWVNGIPNYGILLYSIGPNHILRYVSKENGDVIQLPRLSVAYLEQTSGSTYSELLRASSISGSGNYLVK